MSKQTIKASVDIEGVRLRVHSWELSRSVYDQPKLNVELYVDNPYGMKLEDETKTLLDALMSGKVLLVYED